MIIGLAYDLRIDYENSGHDGRCIAEFDSLLQIRVSDCLWKVPFLHGVEL